MNRKKEIMAIAVINFGTGTDAPVRVLDMVLKEAGIEEKDIEYTVATGYGRITYEKADKQITEITCHAKGVTLLAEGVRTIIDIGGQDAKVIRLNEAGHVEHFVMNEKCAAGTGRFLEVMARVFGCKLEELPKLASKSEKEISISSICTVFAESEVISNLAAGEAIEDVAHGVNVSIAKRVAGLCNRIGYKPKIVMTGGVALNENVVEALGKELDSHIEVVRYSQAAGAIGAALLACENCVKEKENGK